MRGPRKHEYGRKRCDTNNQTAHIQNLPTVNMAATDAQWCGGVKTKGSNFLRLRTANEDTDGKHDQTAKDHLK
jgi:hypothetical protein